MFIVWSPSWIERLLPAVLRPQPKLSCHFASIRQPIDNPLFKCRGTNKGPVISGPHLAWKSWRGINESWVVGNEHVGLFFEGGGRGGGDELLGERNEKKKGDSEYWLPQAISVWSYAHALLCCLWTKLLQSISFIFIYPYSLDSEEKDKQRRITITRRKGVSIT